MANIDDLYSKSFGQLGSVYVTGSSGVITPPTNKVFIAFTVLESATTFNSHGGLIADTNKGEMQYVTTENTSGADVYSGEQMVAHIQLQLVQKHRCLVEVEKSWWLIKHFQRELLYLVDIKE